MASFRKELVDLAKRFLSETDNEATLQAHLHSLLAVLWGVEAIAMEYGLEDGGKIDLVSREKQVAFELKAPGSLRSETSTAFKDGVKQLHGYLSGLAKRDHGSWEGVLTDGKIWYSCHTTPVGIKAQPLVRVAGVDHLLNEIDDLGFITDDTLQGIPPPFDIWGRFSRFDRELGTDIWSASIGEATDNKLGLWSDILRGSGMDEPDPEKKRQLFRRHTFLACFARLVRAQLTEDKRELRHVLGEGYWSWVIGTQKGRSWADRLQRNVDKFNWRLGDTDVLRKLYEDAIGKQQRYTFGEYYTPDWVAQAVVEQVLDDNWVYESVTKALQGRTDGIGALDPACGSGTFLYHAAKRIDKHPALAPYKPSRRSKVIASLVYGIDIHPVAVEIAQVTLLRALPTDPDTKLHIYQGDSLQLKNFGPVARPRGILAPLYLWDIDIIKQHIQLPEEFVKSEDFPDHLEEFLRTAREGAEKPPNWPQYNQETMEDLAKEYERSVKLIAKHGNSVWAWYLLNTIYPQLLAERKLDRIIANPPWVTINSIQDPERAEALKEEAKDLNLWSGREIASKFDIASAFVLKCERLYMPEKEPFKAGWVLNYASVLASTWEPFRDKLPSPHHYWDLSAITPPPFAGAKSAIWYRGFHGQENRKLEPNEKSKAQQSRYQWNVRDWQFQEPDTPIPDFKPRDIPYPVYLDSRNKSLSRNGATIHPACLVRVESQHWMDNGQVWVKTKPARHNPWKEIGQLEGQIPPQWLRSVFHGKDMLPFCARKQPSYAIIPTENNQLISEPTNNLLWESAEREYNLYKGPGPATPATLTHRINYQNGIKNQTEASGLRVSYNNSGNHLRATILTDSSIILDASFYYLSVEDKQEAYYITGILNSQTLQSLYRRSRKSDRHFAAHIWYKIPIPRFQPDDPLHQAIAEIAKQAHKQAQAKLLALDPNNEIGQQTLSRKIRDHLEQRGTSSTLDQITALLLENMKNHSPNLR